jgi:predicted nucleic acid-binding Zn ribbon protein
MPSAAVFADTLQCPYCAQPTEFSDRRCPACGEPLWIRRRVVRQSTTSYWLALALEGILILASALSPLLLLVYVNLQLDVGNVWWLFQRYLGNVTPTSPTLMSAYEILPPILFWLSMVPIPLSIVAVVSILSRWQPLFFVAMSAEGLRLFVVLVSLVILFFGGLGHAYADVEGYFIGTGYRFLRFATIGSVVVLGGLTGFSLSLLMKVMDHFAVEDRRILLRLDRDLEPGGLSYQLRGSEYIKRKMWALAGLHLRRALTFEERVEAYAQLAVAYAHLGYKKLAARALTDARRLNPHSPQLSQLAILLAEQHNIEA